MQGVPDGARHFRIARQSGDLTVGRYLSLRYLPDRPVNAPGRTVRNLLVALPDHPLNILIGNASVQNDRVPMLFILMIARRDRRIDASPEIPPRRIGLNIQMDQPVLFIGPEKRFFASLHSDKLPIWIMKRRLLIGILKR